jgi:hypothetical protein
MKPYRVLNCKTGKLLPPLAQAFNLHDYREMVYLEVVRNITHRNMSNIADNARTKRVWRNAIGMAMHGKAVVDLWLVIDEMLKRGEISQESTTQASTSKKTAAKISKAVKQTKSKGKPAGKHSYTKAQIEELRKQNQMADEMAIEEKVRVGVTLSNYYAAFCEDRGATIKLLKSIRDKSVTVKEVMGEVNERTGVSNLMDDHQKHYLMIKTFSAKAATLKLKVAVISE